MAKSKKEKYKKYREQNRTKINKARKQKKQEHHNEMLAIYKERREKRAIANGFISYDEMKKDIKLREKNKYSKEHNCFDYKGFIRMTGMRLAYHVSTKVMERVIIPSKGR